jgi:hypothetical protein
LHHIQFEKSYQNLEVQVVGLFRFQLFKGFRLCCTPMKWHVLHCKLVDWGSNGIEIFNKPTIEASKSFMYSLNLLHQPPRLEPKQQSQERLPCWCKGALGVDGPYNKFPTVKIPETTRVYDKFHACF